MKSLGTMLKSELGPAVDSPDLSLKERTARKQQMQRYMSDYKASAETFEEVRGGEGRGGGRATTRAWYPKPTVRGLSAAAKGGMEGLRLA